MKPLVLGTAGLLVALLAACGADESATPQPSTSATAAESAPAGQGSSETTEAPSAQPSEPAGPVVEVTIDGENVSPKGDRIDAKVGEPITFVVTSDRTGGLHVHSSPEQSPEFKVGTTTISVTVDKPGLVDVEEHESNALIVQLEVR